jgi:TetR/AcrR family transcriptional regulator, cholesterol catabolism regulator
MPDIRNTREKLLQAAVDLFFEKGYASTSIREIGTKAGITNSLIYHYFTNKEEMLFEIVNRSVGDLIDTLNEITRGLSDPLECLRQMLIGQTALLSAKREKESKILFSEYHWLTGAKRKALRKSQRAVYDLYMAKCRELKQKGILNDIDLSVLTFSIFGVLFGFFRWYRDTGSLTKEDVAENIWKFLFYGMLKARPDDKI